MYNGAKRNRDVRLAVSHCLRVYLIMFHLENHFICYAWSVFSSVSNDMQVTDVLKCQWLKHRNSIYKNDDEYTLKIVLFFNIETIF